MYYNGGDFMVLLEVLQRICNPWQELKGRTPLQAPLQSLLQWRGRLGSLREQQGRGLKYGRGLLVIAKGMLPVVLRILNILVPASGSNNEYLKNRIRNVLVLHGYMPVLFLIRPC